MKKAFKVLSKYSPSELFSKLSFRVFSSISDFKWNSYYLKNSITQCQENIKFSDFKVDVPENIIDIEISAFLSAKYIEHKFQILNVNWLTFDYTETIDREGIWLEKILHTNHQKQAKAIWEKIQLINPKYIPINWQLDHVSKFSFKANLTHTQQRQFINTGVEIKHPWELSRLHHLVQLALFAKEDDEKTIKEVVCQMYDFMMTNPPGMGVNWECTMEVGIRISNMLLAFDWIKQKDKSNIIDKNFEDLFTQYVYQHGKYIVNHFEYKKGLTANHYLGNIAGLAFVSSYLAASKEILTWQILSKQEIEKETQLQFFTDGSNFEGSTSYHKLSAEMVVYATAILEKSISARFSKLKSIKSFKTIFGPNLKEKTITNLKVDSIFSSLHYDYIYRISSFIKAYSKTDGSIVQIGDNDSGSFLKLTPAGEFYTYKKLEKNYYNVDGFEGKTWIENNINHSTLSNLISGIFESSLKNKTKSIESSFAKSLINQKETPTIKKALDFTFSEFKLLEHTKTKEIIFSDYNYNSEQNLQLNHFKDFGFISFQSERLFLTIYYGANEKAFSSWGHQHNDKLSFELNINGENIFVDPGTFAYSSNPEMRNKFRSNFSHNNVVINNEEQNLFPDGIWGLFNYFKRVKTKLIAINKNYIILSNTYGSYSHFRKIDLLEDRIVITDTCNHSFEQVFNNTLYSDGYGKLNKSIN